MKHQQRVYLTHPKMPAFVHGISYLLTLTFLFLVVVTTNVCLAAEIVGIGGKCFDVKSANHANGTPVILWPCHGKANQQWNMVDGLIVGLAGKCLDVKGGSSANGTSVILWQCHGKPNQRWNLVDGKIVGLAGKCLDVNGGGTANGTSVILWPCHGKANQQWQFYFGW